MSACGVIALHIFASKNQEIYNIAWSADRLNSKFNTIKLSGNIC